MTDLLKVKGLDHSHMLGKASRLLLMPSGERSFWLGLNPQCDQPRKKYTPTYTGAPPGGFSSQLSRSAGWDIEGRSESAGLWPRRRVCWLEHVLALGTHNICSPLPLPPGLQWAEEGNKQCSGASSSSSSSYVAPVMWGTSTVPWGETDAS